MEKYLVEVELSLMNHNPPKKVINKKRIKVSNFSNLLTKLVAKSQENIRINKLTINV